MTVTIDTNVILDLIWQREPFLRSAQQIFKYVERGILEGYICATSVTTIFYLIEKESNHNKALDVIQSLLQLFEINSVNKDILVEATRSGYRDFEDGVISHAAVRSGAQAIVTRNSKDFSKSTIPVYHPDVFVAIMEKEKN